MPPFESFDAVSSGTAEMYHAADYYFQGKSKALNFFTTVPFGLTATEMDAWIHHGGGQELWDELSGDFGIKPFAAGNTGVQMGGWFRNEINTLDDFKGPEDANAGARRRSRSPRRRDGAQSPGRRDIRRLAIRYHRRNGMGRPLE